jgi:uncharacterized protein with GYD domain
MPKFVILLNYTDQGIRNIKDGPQRVREAIHGAEAAGAKVEAWYLTMGTYDAIAIAEAPDDETAAALLLALGVQGNVRSETLRAFSLDEFERILAKMP